MSISSSANDRNSVAVTRAKESRSSSIPITLSERSMTGLALIRIFVGYLWFQQLFWKMPPDFAGLYPYIIRESQHTIIPGYGYVLQHTFLNSCTSLHTASGCTFFVPLAAGAWIAELIVAMSLMFGLFTRVGAILGVILAAQLYIGLAYAPGEWYWTYGMLVLLCLVLTAIPAGRRLGVDQWLAPRLQATASSNRFARFMSWFA
jgi:thiosulfate dehydrogenase [quinone] large subunit